MRDASGSSAGSSARSSFSATSRSRCAIPGAVDVAERPAAEPLDQREVRPVADRRRGRCRAARRRRGAGGRPQRQAAVQHRQVRQDAELSDDRLVVPASRRFRGVPVDRRRRRQSIRRASAALRLQTCSRLISSRQPQQRAADRHARRVGRWLAERLRHVLIAAVHLDARDDRFALFRPQPRERRFVALQRFAADRGFERRRAAIASRCRRARVAPASAWLRRTSSRMRLTIAWRRYACSAPSCRDSNRSIRLTARTTVSCTRSSVSIRSRLQRGSRPLAQRRSDGQKARKQPVQRVVIARLGTFDQIVRAVDAGRADTRDHLAEFYGRVISARVVHGRPRTGMPDRAGFRMIKVPRPGLKSHLQSSHCDSGPDTSNDAACGRKPCSCLSKRRLCQKRTGRSGQTVSCSVGRLAALREMAG